MIKKLLIANWKMNISHDKGYNLIYKISKSIKQSNSKEYIFLPSIQSILYFKNKLFNQPLIYGAQDCSPFNKGAYTGDVSAEMIKKIGCKYVLIGHSERRRYYQEDKKIISEKLKRASDNGLKIILCIGEDLNDYKNKTSLKKIKNQLNDLFYPNFNFKKLIIAYEPVWAIGSNRIPKLIEIDEVHSFIKEFFQKKYKIYNIPVLYGGSVNAKNSKDIFSLKNVDGGLIGGASLIASEFCKIYVSL